MLGNARINEEPIQLDASSFTPNIKRTCPCHALRSVVIAGAADTRPRRKRTRICIHPPAHRFAELGGQTSIIRFARYAKNRFETRRRAMNQNRYFARTCTNIQILRSAPAWRRKRPGNRSSMRWRHQKQRNSRSRPPAERRRSRSKQ